MRSGGVFICRDVRPQRLQGWQDLGASDAVNAPDVAVPAEGKEVGRGLGPSAARPEGVEVAAVDGDEIPEGSGSAATWFAGADRNAVGPAIGSITHSQRLSKVNLQLAEPQPLLAVSTGPC